MTDESTSTDAPELEGEAPEAAEATAADTEVPASCLNCGARLAGEYCHDCGQRDIDPRASLWEVLGEFIQESLELDGRLPRTLLPFLFRPGFLAHEFMEGRRQRYTSPVRLYVFAALVSFFLLQSKFTSVLEDGAVRFNEGGSVSILRDGDRKGEAALTDEEAEQLRQELRKELPPDVANAIVLDEARGAGNSGVIEFDSDSPLVPPKYRGLQGPQLMRAVLGDFFGWIPIGTVALLIVFAFVLKSFFWRVPYLTHLVNSTHVHAFGLLALGTAVYLPWSGALGWALLVVHVYVLVALRRSYEQPWWLTVLKFFGLTLIYWMLASLTFVGVGALATSLG